MESILVKLVEEDFGIKHDSAKWARAEVHDSLIVDKEKDIFHWNKHDMHGTPLFYLTEVRGMQKREAIELLKHFSTYVDTFIHEIKGNREVVIYPKLVEVFHENIWEDDREYFYRRTIIDETISRWKLGKYNNFYTIPVYVDGVLKNIQLRKDDPKVIRYYYPGEPVLFNGDMLKFTNEVYITEGTTSCIVLNQNKLPAISPSSGANAFLDSFIPAFLHQKRIYVLFDNDDAGKNGSLRIARLLGEYRTKIYNFWDFDPGYDANDFFKDGGTADELDKLVKEKAKYSFQIGGLKPLTNRKYGV